MGCDIHLWVEVRDSAGWRFANPYRMGEYDKEYEDEEWVDWDEPYAQRNYYLFAILAGVRGHGMPFTAISIPRGMPDDISDVGRKICEQWKADAHSHSWLLASELHAYNWTSLVTFKGFVQHAALEDLQKNGKAPQDWWPDRAGQFMWPAEWQERIDVCAGSFYDKFMPALKEYGSRDQVRIVFFFDN